MYHGLIILSVVLSTLLPPVSRPTTATPAMAPSSQVEQAPVVTTHMAASPATTYPGRNSVVTLTITSTVQASANVVISIPNYLPIWKLQPSSTCVNVAPSAEAPDNVRCTLNLAANQPQSVTFEGIISKEFGGGSIPISSRVTVGDTTATDEITIIVRAPVYLSLIWHSVTMESERSSDGPGEQAP